MLLRVLQGLGAGAEFGGASTLLAEHAPPERRGYYTSFAQTGVQVGLVLGHRVVPAGRLLPQDDLLSWGWRVPFLLSFLLIARRPLRAAAGRGVAGVPRDAARRSR